MPDTIPEINYTLDPSETIPAPVDPSLSIEGMAADAQATGEALAKKLTTYGELDPLDAPQGTDEIPVGRSDAEYTIDLATLREFLLTQAAQVSSVSVGDSTYISSVSGGYVKLGRLVVFSIGYTMASAISQSAPGAIAGLPSVLSSGRFLVFDALNVYDFSTPRFANVIGTTITIKGPHTAGDTYYVSGAYISAS